MFADITLPIPFDSFTYLVPSDMESRVMRGCRVVVSLGKNKIYTGVVLRTHDKAPEGVEIKPILEVLDEHPVVNEQQFAFWQWIANYYLCPLGDVMTAALPGAMKPKDEKALKESLDGVTALTMDFEKLDYISSAGLRVLLATQKVMAKQGTMKLCHVNETIMEIFEVTGFTDILTIE